MTQEFFFEGLIGLEIEDVGIGSVLCEPKIPYPLIFQFQHDLTFYACGGNTFNKGAL